MDLVGQRYMSVIALASSGVIVHPIDADRPPCLTSSCRAQSGGVAAVEAAESMSVTLQPGPKGILMRCIPRA